MHIDIVLVSRLVEYEVSDTLPEEGVGDREDQLSETVSTLVSCEVENPFG